MAYLVTFTAAQPIAGLRVDRPAWVGVWLGDNAGRTRDGITVQGAGYGAGELPHPNAPGNTWRESLAGGASGGLAMTSPRVNLRLGMAIPAPVFEVGAEIDPAIARMANVQFGVAGRWPNQLGRRGDGMVFRVTAAGFAGQPVVVLMNLVPASAPWLTVPNVFGYVTILGPGLLSAPVASGTVSTNGVFLDDTLFPFPNPLPLPQGAVVEAQAVILAGVPRFTNSCVVTQL